MLEVQTKTQRICNQMVQFHDPAMLATPQSRLARTPEGDPMYSLRKPNIFGQGNHKETLRNPLGNPKETLGTPEGNPRRKPEGNPEQT